MTSPTLMPWEKGKLPQTHVFPEMSILGVEYVCTIVPAPAQQWTDKL